MKILATFLICCLSVFQGIAQNDVMYRKSTSGKVKKINFTQLVQLQKLKKGEYKILATPDNAGNKVEEEKEKEEREHWNDNTERDKKLLSIPAPAVTGRLKKGTESNLASTVNCKSFEGLNEILVNSAPPDVSMALGVDHMVMAINTGILITNKNTGYVDSIANTTFWSSLGFTDFFDPKIMYDHVSNRWIMCIVAERRLATSAICLAVSETSDPTANWYVYFADADGANTYWFDYPGMGFSSDKIVITGNLFANSNDANGPVRMYIFNKIDLYNGIISAFINTIDNSSIFTLLPATQFDAGADVVCITQQDGLTGKLSKYIISGAAATATIGAAATVDYAVAWTSPPSDMLPQTGTTLKINGGSSRVLSFVIRNNIGYVAFNGAYPANAPTYMGATYCSFNNATNAIGSIAAFTDPAGSWMTAFPNLIVTSNGTILISFSYFSTTTYGSAAVGIWNPSDGAFSNATYIVTKFGTDIYDRVFGGRNRWGDYSGIALDPTDEKTVWLASEYAANRDPAPGNASRWGTWFSKYCADCPANLTVTNTLLNTNAKKYEVTNTINSSQNVNSGAYLKLDAANAIIMLPGFRAQVGSILKAFIEGCGGADF
jgi:hypothetical protein